MASRVVPDMSWTTDRSSPTSRLKSVDLPTFGRPTMATRGVSGAISRDSSSSHGATSSSRTEARSPRRSSTTSSRSPARRPCNALTGMGSPRPRAKKSHISRSRPSLSALFATTITSTPLRRNHAAISSSWLTVPTLASTTSNTRSAELTAASTCLLTFSSRSSPPGIQPPVSTMVNGTPSHSASSSFRSRVMPGRSSVIATCSPAMRLKSVDFPTFGRPTTTTVGNSVFSVIM